MHYNNHSGKAAFYKKENPYMWRKVDPFNWRNAKFFNNNTNKIVKIEPRLSNKYPELYEYSIKIDPTFPGNGLYIRPSNYLNFRQTKTKENNIKNTLRKARGLEAMIPRLLASLKRAQRRSRIREFFTYLKENMQKPNSPLKRKFPNSNAEKARKKAAANKEAANKAARNALNAQLAASRNYSRRLREENEARRLGEAGSYNANTWQRNVNGTVTRKNSKQKNNR
jgi:hypothetical protein